MKVRDLLKDLNTLIEKNEKVLDFDVIYSKDDEGNEYKRICYSPSLGSYDDGEFFDCHDQSGLKDNALCIN